MSNIALNTAKLPVASKLVKGQEIITMSTNNLDVPGNTAALAAFTTAQNALEAAHAAYEASRQACAELHSARVDAIAAWTTALTGLAGVTESITQGEKTKILSAGFDVRGEPTPPQPLAPPVNLQVHTNGSPGVSSLDWDALDGAVSYVVEYSPDPITADSWEPVAVTTRSAVEVAGAEPGRKCWYRVAGVNAAGQGPWSSEAPRNVM